MHGHGLQWMVKSKGNVRAQHQRRRARARLAHLQWLKDHGPCCLCQSWDHLEIDHVIPTGLGRKYRISQALWLWSKSRRDLELSKCQILCRSCHRIKTSKDLRKFEHGLNLYDRHGCRCSICKAAMAKSKREYRARRSTRLKILKMESVRIGGGGRDTPLVSGPTR